MPRMFKMPRTNITFAPTLTAEDIAALIVGGEASVEDYCAELARVSERGDRFRRVVRRRGALEPFACERIENRGRAYYYRPVGAPSARPEAGEMPCPWGDIEPAPIEAEADPLPF